MGETLSCGGQAQALQGLQAQARDALPDGGEHLGHHPRFGVGQVLGPVGVLDGGGVGILRAALGRGVGRQEGAILLVGQAQQRQHLQAAAGRSRCGPRPCRPTASRRSESSRVTSTRTSWRWLLQRRLGVFGLVAVQLGQRHPGADPAARRWTPRSPAPRWRRRLFLRLRSSPSFSHSSARRARALGLSATGVQPGQGRRQHLLQLGLALAPLVGGHHAGQHRLVLGALLQRLLQQLAGAARVRPAARTAAPPPGAGPPAACGSGVRAISRCRRAGGVLVGAGRPLDGERLVQQRRLGSRSAGPSGPAPRCTPCSAPSSSPSACTTSPSCSNRRARSARSPEPSASRRRYWAASALLAPLQRQLGQRLQRRAVIGHPAQRRLVQGHRALGALQADLGRRRRGPAPRPPPSGTCAASA